MRFQLPTDLRSKSVRYLASCVDDLLAFQDDDGVFHPETILPVRNPADFQQFGFYPLALLFTLDHPDNPYSGDVRLLEAAARSCDHNVSVQQENGGYVTGAWDGGGGGTGSPNNWRTFSFFKSWELLRNHVNAERAAGWEAALERTVDLHYDAALHQVAEEGYGENHNVRNHPTWYLLNAYVVCSHFGRTEQAERMAEELERVCAVQHPSGCWFEHDGPVCVYQHISMASLSHYYRLTGSEAARVALARSIDFYRHMYYPNGHPVGIIDGRVRYAGYPMSILPTAWADTPEGRSLLHLVMDSVLEHGLGGGHEIHGGWLGLAFHTQFLVDLPEREPADALPAPLVADGYHQLADMPVALIRKGPWTVVASGFTRQPHDDNRWTLDYQNHISIYHESGGLVAGGGNGKRQDPLSSFTAGSRPLGLPLLASSGSVESLDETGLAVTLDYGNFTGRIEAHITKSAVTLTASVQGCDDAWFQLPMPMKQITGGVTGSGIPIHPEAVGNLNGKALGGSLSLSGRGTVTGLSQRARAILSYLPYNSHRQDGIYTSDKRVAVVAEPVPEDGSIALTITPDP